MKRLQISLAQIAERANLLEALQKALRGKRSRPEVVRWLTDGERNLNRLAMDIIAGRTPYNRYSSFIIHDPKRRHIFAPCLDDRIFHHGLMNLAGPFLDRAMSPLSFACRKDKGVYRAVQAVQARLRKYPWYVQVDIEGYFDHIDHRVLKNLLEQKFKGAEFRQLVDRILAGYHRKPGKGLPIGALTSQNFANFYLDGLDRTLACHPQVMGHVRYMDDVVWWCRSRNEARNLLAEIADYLTENLHLRLKPTSRIQRSSQGILFCGFRITPWTVRLSRRRQRGYKRGMRFWKNQYDLGHISEMELQRGVAAVHSIAQGTDSLAWRRKIHRRLWGDEV